MKCLKELFLGKEQDLHDRDVPFHDRIGIILLIRKCPFAIVLDFPRSQSSESAKKTNILFFAIAMTNSAIAIQYPPSRKAVALPFLILRLFEPFLWPKYIIK